jgi:hypothetical protein
MTETPFCGIRLLTLPGEVTALQEGAFETRVGEYQAVIVDRGDPR